MCISPLDWRRRLWLSFPRRQGLKQVNCTGHNNGQAPPQRREARFAKRRCPLHPGGFCRDAGSAGHGATEAARPERRCKPGVSRQGWKPARAETACWLRSRQPPRQGDARKRHCQRTTKQTGIRAAVIRVRTGGKENNQREGDVISDRS